MDLTKIIELLDAEVFCGGDNLDQTVISGCGSDLMSDVLAFSKERSVLLTGLVNNHSIRTAEMMDMPCIVFVRGKKPTDDIIETAKELGIVLLGTNHTSYTSCGILFTNGLVGASGRV